MSQARPSTSTSLQGPKVLIFFITLAPIMGLGFVWNGYVTRFQAARCPSDTFMVHDNTPGLAVILQISFLIVLILFLYSVLFPIIIKNLDSRESSQYRAIRRVCGIVAAVLGVSMAYAMPTHLLSQVCLTPGGIYMQDGAFDHWQRHPWSDVSTVSTSCWHSRDWYGAMHLNFKDGETIGLFSNADLASKTPSWSEYLPKVVEALHGHDFKFDASGVGRVCWAPGAAMLRARP